MKLLERRDKNGMPIVEDEKPDKDELLINIIMMLLSNKMIEDKRKTPTEAITDRPESNIGYMPMVSGIGS